MRFYDYLSTKTRQKNARLGGRDWESARLQTEFFYRRPLERAKELWQFGLGGLGAKGWSCSNPQSFICGGAHVTLM